MNARSAASPSASLAAGAEPELPPRPTWWIRVASSGWNAPLRLPEDRERVRRSRLTAWIILGLLLATLVLLPGGLAAPMTLVAIATVDVGLLIAVVLNRGGFVSAAGALLSLLISGAILFAVASTGALSLVYLPAYDLFVISVVVGASVLSGRAAFWIAGLNIVLILASFNVQGHAADLAAAIRTFGVASMVVRPIALQVIVATVAFLWMRGTHEAVQRADRAEEVAALEHAVAEHRRQLEIGVQQILETHVRVANGDFSARAPMSQDNILWQIAASLNTLLARLQKSGQAEYQLRRTDEELRRLAAAIDDAQMGRRPIWPAPTGTSADLIIERITNRGRHPAPQGIAGPARQGTYQVPPMPVPSTGQLGPLTPAMPISQAMPVAPLPPMEPSMQPVPPMSSPLLRQFTGPLPPFGQVAPDSSPARPPAAMPPANDATSGAPDNPWFAPPEEPSW